MSKVLDGVARFRLDDLRRFGSALVARAGLEPARAATFVGHRAWFDLAGEARFGLATLPEWVDRIERREFDPKSDGRIESELPGAAVLDARGGVPALVLERAAGLAIEKARDAGVGLVRVRGLKDCGPASPVAAQIALGPEVGLVLGPGTAWTLAIPTLGALPIVCDTALAQPDAPGPPAALADVLAHTAGTAPWAFLATDGLLVAAVSIKALEPPASFEERVHTLLDGRAEAQGLLLPAAWENRRREVRERGLALSADVWAALRTRAERLGVDLPAPVSA